MQGFNKMERIIDDYVFTQLTSPKVSDALVIHNPPFATCKSPVLLQSRKTLDDHIAYIRDNELKKAVIVADDISFLRNCPSLECLWIIPALSACDFDYSPLYDLPNIRHLKCETVYGYKEDRIAHVDYSRLPRLQSLAVCNTQGHHHIESAKSLKVLFFENGPSSKKTLHGVFDGSHLENLVISQSHIHSLEGIECATSLQRIELLHNKDLKDISALSSAKESLVWLDISNCNGVQDFSVLSELHRLKLLRLRGQNNLPSLSFLNNMPDLEFLVITMNVEDGDLGCCMDIPYVSIRNRQHYTHKDKEFSKFPDSPQVLSFWE